jgi:ADP-heptose:LPS heptosyltransferase
MKILAGRAQLIGDQLGALPVAGYFRKLYPQAKIIWPCAKKVSQAAPLYLNHPYIDQIYIYDGMEGPESMRDFQMHSLCDIIINPNPQHPFEHDWPNYRTFYQETFVMAGLPLHLYESLSLEEKFPKLYKWFNVPERSSFLPDWVEKKHKVIALWPFAGYGKEGFRTPSVEWYNNLINKLMDYDIHVVVFGHPNDPNLFSFDYDITEGHKSTWFVHKMRHIGFFEQIKNTLACDLVLSTDSGSGLIFAAYGHPQINFITNHWPNHKTNPLALAPQGERTFNFFGKGGADCIDIDAVLVTIKEYLNI